MARKITKKVRLGLYAAIVFLLGFIGNSSIARQDTTTASQPRTGGGFVSSVYADDPFAGPCPTGGPCCGGA